MGAVVVLDSMNEVFFPFAFVGTWQGQSSQAEVHANFRRTLSAVPFWGRVRIHYKGSIY